MKKIITYSLITLLFLIGNVAFSQQATEEDEGFEGKNLKTMHAETEWYKLMQVAEPNIFDVQKAYDRYFLVNTFEKSKETRAFDFWKKHIVGDNYDANGNVGKQTLNYDDLKLLEASSQRMKAKNASAGANWSRIVVKPDVTVNWTGGCYTQGTCNMLAINPSNSNEMIAAFIDGGTLWRTIDAGAHWTQCAQDLLLRQFGSVVYCKNNPLVVYAGSAHGVIKSTDGGSTWTMTGYDQRAGYPGGNQIWAMEVKADDPNSVVFAFNNVLYRTTNGGTTWTTSTLTGTSVRDLRALPGSPNVLFMTIKNGAMAELRRSADFGATWTKITDGYPASLAGYTGEMAFIAVSPAAPKSVWVHLVTTATGAANAVTYDIYKSVNSGLTFSRMNITTDISQKFYQGGWNQAFAVSDVDTLLMAHASWGVMITRDGGKTWANSAGENGKFNEHSDLHSLVIKDQTLWAAGDGGIQKTTDYGVTYDQNSDDDIQCQCLWGFDQGWKNDIMATGMYHGPTTVRDDAIYNGWFPMGGADAGTAFVNTSDDRYIYAHPWGNVRYKRSASRTVNPTYIDITTIMSGKNSMNDPDYYEKVYGANASKLMVSGDNATTFSNGYNFAANLSDYVVALLNNKIAYARTGNTIMKTEDGGVFWTNVSPSTAVTGGQNISQLAIDGTNPSVLWVSIEGKQTTNKVAKSTDGGKTWVNYTGKGLPSYSVNCIIGQMGTDGDVYVGTDAGVYYRNNSMTTWSAYSTNLPIATHVDWLKINYSKAKLRLAGQTGIWETDLNSISTPFAHPSTPIFETSVGKQVQFVDMSVCLANATYEWTFPDGNPASSTLEKPIVTFTAGGDKNITLKVTDANGTDTRTYNSFLRVRPVIDVPKTGWVVTYFDSQYNTTTYVAPNVIDGNNNTIWVSKGTGTTKYPHDIQVDMGTTTSIESFKYTPRQDGNILGKVKDYEWYVSADGINWGTPVASGSYDATDATKVTTLNVPATGRYFRFRPMSANDATGFASVAELGVNGSTALITSFAASATLVNAGTIVKFTDNTAGNPTSWLWSFPGGTPSTSTEQHPTVQYNTDGVYPVTLTATGVKGSDTQQKNSYITVSKYLPTSGWSVKYVDSEESKSEKTPATNIFDGSNGTIWHTQYSPTITPYPHEVQIDMGGNYAVTGFTYVPRQTGTNGRIANYEFSVSTDGTTWTLVKSGTFPNSAAEQAITFTEQTIRYFKMKALSEVNGGGYASIAEIKLPYAVSVAAGINNPLNNNVAIYSYQNEIKVSIIDQTRAKMQVFDITGCELISTNINQGINSVTIGHPGVYIVKVLVNNGVISKKVIVE